MQVMASQISHPKITGPGGLQASVQMLTIKRGRAWHTTLQPGYMLTSSLPGRLLLRLCSPLPCSALPGNTYEELPKASDSAFPTTMALAQVMLLGKAVLSLVHGTTCQSFDKASLS